MKNTNESLVTADRRPASREGEWSFGSAATESDAALAGRLIETAEAVRPWYLERLRQRARAVASGSDAATAEREQMGDDAMMLALRRLAERLTRQGPLG